MSSRCGHQCKKCASNPEGTTAKTSPFSQLLVLFPEHDLLFEVCASSLPTDPLPPCLSFQAKLVPNTSLCQDILPIPSTLVRPSPQLCEVESESWAMQTSH